MTLKLRSLVVASVLSLLGTGLLATPAHGATITVDTLVDNPVANGTMLIPNQKCSLREAIFAANNDVPVDTCDPGNGADTIELAVNSTYILDVNDPAVEEDMDRRGDLDIYETGDGIGDGIGNELNRAAVQPGPPRLTIEGNGSTVNGANLLHCNVFHILGVSVVINSLTIQGGGSQTIPPEGGGFQVEGGSLVLNDSTVRDNRAQKGGGIYNDGGHVELSGGTTIGPENEATLDGGGIWTTGSTGLVVKDSTIEGNTAGLSGGGIYQADTVTLERSTVNDNVAQDGNGGGIWTAGTLGLTATNSTISGNDAEDIANAGPGGKGGGIYLSGTGSFVLRFVTVANNNADVGGGNIGIGISGGTGSVDRTIIANGTAAEGAGQNCSLDVNADIDSLEFNMSDRNGDSDSSLATSCRLDDASDITGQNPNLGDLDDNGGFTETRSLSQSSPAVDSAGVSCSISTDQRGLGRPSDGDSDGTPRCDRGAFELQAHVGGGNQGPPPPPTPPVSECTITGTTGDDILLGSDVAETICGLEGNDLIRAAGGNDKVFGNEGNDTLEGGSGDDSLTGGPGIDTGDYTGAPGSVDADLVRGTAVGVGASTDSLFDLENLIGSPYRDELRGDGGANILIGNASPDLLVGRGGPDLMRGKGGNDEVAGAGGKDLLKGGGNDDRLRGGQDDDRLGGGAQDDRLLGNEGDDTILGWEGDDYLNGKSGTDSCEGGVGTNTLVNCET